MKPGSDPLGLQGPLPPLPAPNLEDYAKLQKKYPALFPPGGAPRYADPNLMLVGQKKSSLPGQSFVIGLIGVGANSLLIAMLIMLIIDPSGGIFIDDMCCLFQFFIWVIAFATSLFGIIFGSISLYNVKAGKYQFHNKAKPAFILSLISGSLFALFHLGTFLFFMASVWF